MNLEMIERRIDDRRGDDARRRVDVQRMMLEETLRELPKYFVSFIDKEKGVYSFYYNNMFDAQEMVKNLRAEGVPSEAIALYARHED